MITKCTFGAMTINNRLHKSDLKIFPDGRVDDGWRRAAGHRLETGDICDLLDTRPDILVVGTGIYGLMRTSGDFKAALAQNGIELIAARTKSAAQTYNRLKEQGQKVAACFHLTC